MFHPPPNEYNLPVKVAFSKIRDYIAEVHYNYGDKWRVVTADTKARRIIANLRFTDEHEDFEGRTKRLQRFINVVIQFKDTGHDTAVVEFDFTTEIEGMAFFACDSIVSDFCRDMHALLQTAAPTNND